MLCDAEGHARILLDEQDTDTPAPCDRRDDLGDFLNHPRCEADRGLIQQEKPGAGHERPPDRQHLLLAAAEAACALAGTLLEPRKMLVGHGEIVVESGIPEHQLASAQPPIGAHPQILEHGHVREDAAPLRYVRDSQADDLVGGHAVDALAVEQNFAGAGALEAGDRAHEGGLAGSVGSDQRHEGALGHSEGNSLERRRSPMMDPQILDLEQHDRRYPSRALAGVSRPGATPYPPPYRSALTRLRLRAPSAAPRRR